MSKLDTKAIRKTWDTNKDTIQGVCDDDMCDLAWLFNFMHDKFPALLDEMDFLNRRVVKDDSLLQMNDNLQADNSRLRATLEGLRSQAPPCGPTCYHHQTHPCEDCGRISGYLPVVLKDAENKRLRAEIQRTIDDFLGQCGPCGHHSFHEGCDLCRWQKALKEQPQQTEQENNHG